MAANTKQNLFTNWLTPLFISIAFFLLFFKITFPLGILWSGLMLSENIYGHREPIAETSFLFIIYLILKSLGYHEPFILFFPLMVTLILWASWKTRYGWMQWIFGLLALLWLTQAAILLEQTSGILGWTIWGSTLLAAMIHLLFLMRNNKTPLQNLDVILCSFSGHTADYTNYFMKGVQQQGASCTVHRFHYADQFQPNLSGDGLVLAFPVSGWKPPWPLIAYLWKKLPYGAGKPAFILYTAMGGPENAGMVAWFLLSLKGYRVQGSQWAFYPNNVPTLRLGLNAFWKWLDRIVPFKNTLSDTSQAGEDFVQGKRPGHPLILWPSPLAIAGLILDNRWTNIAIYRNYIWRWRCIQCGLCIRHCPTQRLFMYNGYPKAKGTCALCMGCINLCPKRAMQMLLWTEYGHAYHSRWSQFIVKSTSDKLLNKDTTK